MAKTSKWQGLPTEGINSATQNIDTIPMSDVVALMMADNLVALEAVERRGIPAWLDLDKGGFKGTVKAAPSRDDITMPIQEQLIVELYSK